LSEFVTAIEAEKAGAAIDKDANASNLNGIQKVEINMVNINIKKPADF